MPKFQNKKAYEEQLYDKVSELIFLARRQVITSVNTTMVHTYFQIGRLIVEDEQQGKERAEYGKAILKALSHQLTQKFGKGFSTENLDRMRFFYKVYAPQISSTLLTKSQNIYETNSGKSGEDEKLPILQAGPAALQPYTFRLSWSHYIRLMRIKKPKERRFYEIECLQPILP